MGEGYMNGARALGLGPAVRVPRPLEPEGVGAALASAQKQIVNCGRSLAGLVEPAGQALIGEAINRLDQQVFRVAVVGQIKSGKSSFINAFVRQPRLLPTDVTPWTTTVTHLHFGEAAPGSARPRSSSSPPPNGTISPTATGACASWCSAWIRTSSRICCAATSKR